jgi:hypothetical protein
VTLESECYPVPDTLDDALGIALIAAGHAAISIVFRLARGVGVEGDRTGLVSDKPHPVRDTVLLSLGILWLA